MDAGEPVQSRSKRDLGEHMDGRQSRYEDDDDWDNAERKRHKSSKLSRFNSTDVEEQDSGRRKSSGDKDEGRKKSGGLGQAESPNEDDYEIKRESRSKISRKNTAERSVMRSNEGYRGKDLEGSQKGIDEYIDLNSSRKKNSSPGQDSPECKGRNKVDNPPEGEAEKTQDRESRYSDRKENNSRERGHGQREQERNISSRRRWDDMGSWRKIDDGNYMDRSDSRSGKSSEQGSLRDRASDPRIDSGHTRGRTADSSGEKGVTCTNRDGKRGDVERKRGLSEIQGDDHREISETIRDDKLTKVRMRSPAVTEDMEWRSHSGKSHIEKGEKHKQQQDALHGSHDEVEIMERSDEDVQPRIRDKYGRNGRYNRSPSPEGSKRYPEDMEDHDRDHSESDTERNTAVKVKDSLKDNRDFRPSKGKDGSWNDRNMDRESSKDYWRSQSKQDTKVVNEFDNIRGWDSQSYEPVKMDGDKLHFRPGYKKDNRVRSEGGRFENSDSIEIKPNHNLDFVNNVSVSTFPGRVAEVGLAQDSSGAGNDDEWGYPTDDKAKVGYGSSDDLQEKFHDVDSPLDQISGRNSLDSQAGKGRGQKGPVNSSRIGQGPNSSSSSQAPFGYNQGSSSFNRISQQGQKGGKAVRGGRGRMTGRDAQRGGLPMHMMGPPFGHLGLPPGTMQSLGPNMPPSVGPPLAPGVFIPPFAGTLSWPTGRGVDINMLAAPPNLPPIPLGPAGPRFAPNLGAGPNQVMYFNQQGSGRINSNLSGPEFNSNGPVVRETSNDKVPAVWGQSRTGGPAGKAPSRGEQNDYSQNFVDTGMRPQNFIRELELTSVVEDYPKLRELIQRKDDIVMNSSTPPLYYKTDLREFTLTPEFFGTKFDVILVDPPWEEYVHRAPGITDHIEYWTFEEIQNLKIEVCFRNLLFSCMLFIFAFAFCN